MMPFVPSVYSSVMLRRIKVSQATCHPFHVGNHGTLEVMVSNPSALPLPAVSIQVPDSEDNAQCDMKGRSQTLLRLPIKGETRGTTQAPPLRIQTLFPFSMFTTWKTFSPDGEYVVYPAPEPNAPIWPDSLEHGSRKVRRGEDVIGFRQHHHDDPLNIVDWKATAKAGYAVVREYQDQDSVLYFAWDQVTQLDTEQGVSRLTAWILMADSQGRSYCLDLPGEAGVPPDAGDAQKHACLTALANYRKPAS